MMYKVLSTIFEKFFIRIMTNKSGFFSVLLIVFLSNTQILHAQNIPNLDVQIVSSPTSAKIGSTIGVTVLQAMWAIKMSQQQKTWLLLSCRILAGMSFRKVTVRP